MGMFRLGLLILGIKIPCIEKKPQGEGEEVNAVHDRFFVCFYILLYMFQKMEGEVVGEAPGEAPVAEVPAEAQSEASEAPTDAAPAE